MKSEKWILTSALALLLLAAVPAGAQGVEPLQSKDIEVADPYGTGVLTVTVLSADEELRQSFSAANFEVVPVFEDAEPALGVSRGQGVPGGIDRYDGPPARRPAVEMVFDVSRLQKPEGAVGYEIVVHGADPAVTARKPANWQNNYWYFYGGTSIGVESLVGCHWATMQSRYGSSWSYIFVNDHQCAGHGAELSPAGWETKINVEFSGDLYHAYKVWRDGTSWTVTYVPGGPPEF